MKKKDIDIKIILAIIAAITILECVALSNGINGTMFSIVLFLLGAIGGVVMPQPKIRS